MGFLKGNRPMFIRSVSVCLGLLTSAVGAFAAPPHPIATRSIAGTMGPSDGGFVANHGQWSSEVLFFASAEGIDATLLRDAIVFRPAYDRERDKWPAPVIVRLPAAAHAVIGEGALPARHHFLIGSKRTTNVPAFDHVVFDDVVAGVDLVLRIERPDGSPARFAYDLHFAPNVRPEDFALTIEGAQQFSLQNDAIAMQTSVGPLAHRIGASWQVDAATHSIEPIAAHFRLLDLQDGAQRVGFSAPERDAQRAFVLDPSLVWGTYIGGPQKELFKTIDVDDSGAVYVLCQSWASSPTTPGSFQPIAPRGSAPQVHAWIGKLSANGQQLEWGTYLGGAEVTDPSALRVDPKGSVTVFGRTWAPDFPTTLAALQPVFDGTVPNSDLFVSRLLPDGSDLDWSTYYGGPNNETPASMELFPNGDVLISLAPQGPTPSATPGAFDTHYDAKDLALARIANDGASLVFQTYFPGGLKNLCVNDESAIYFAGAITKTGGQPPATPGAYKQAMAGSDLGDSYVGRISSDGSTLLWGTYLGGNLNTEQILGLSTDPSGAVYVTGVTGSLDFPVTSGAFQTTVNPTLNGFVTKLLPNGTGLIWSTFLSVCCGGFSNETSLAIGPGGIVYSSGFATHASFPTTPNALQPNFLGSTSVSDAHYTALDPFGESALYSSWFGGNGNDNLTQIRLTKDNEVVLGLLSSSTNNVATPGSFDTVYDGADDLVVAKLQFEKAAWETLTGGKKGGTEMPHLAGGGPLISGATTRLSIRGASPLATGILLAGITSIEAPAIGGIVVPAPDILVPIAVGPNGAFDLIFPWPTVPSGLPLYLQAWLQDPGATFGWSATNAIRLVSQ